MSKVTEINKILRSYLEPFGYEIRHGSDFCCNLDKEVVYWSLYTPANADKYFLEYAHSLGLKYECGVFILSLFHEIGHLETYDDLDEIDIAYSEDEKKLLSKKETHNKADNMHYFGLPEEKIATKWAIEFINTNPDFCREINDKVAAVVY